MTYLVLETQHSAPYDGCFWEYNYHLLTVETDTVQDMDVIYNSGANKHRKMTLESAQELYEAACRGDDGYESSTQWFHSDPRIFKLDDDLHNHIPTTLIPTIAAYFNGSYMNDVSCHTYDGYTFKWACDVCGLTDAEPYYQNGYHGNGGIGIEVDGWICENCPDPDDTTVWCPTCGEQWDSESIKTIEYDSYQGTDEEFDALLHSVERVPDEQMALDGFKKPVWIRNYDYIEAVIVDSDDNSHCPYCHGQLEA